MGGALAHHVLLHDGGLRRLAGRLVVVLKGHDEHRVRVLAELDEVRHPANDGPVCGLTEGRLVDGAVRSKRRGHRRGSSRGGPRLGASSGQPSFWDCKHAAGVVAKLDEGGDSLAGHRAVGLEERAAVGDGHGLAADRLADDAALAEKEAPFRDVGDRRRRAEGDMDFLAGKQPWGELASRAACPTAAASCSARSPVEVTLVARRHRAGPSGSRCRGPSRDDETK